MTNEPFFTPNLKAAPARQPTPGVEVWRLRHADGRVQTCELRDHSQAGAGWHLTLLLNGDLVFSRQCRDEPSARYAAQALRQDNMRGGGWVEQERKAMEGLT
jgi:hypothetical protein